MSRLLWFEFISELAHKNTKVAIIAVACVVLGSCAQTCNGRLIMVNLSVLHLLALSCWPTITDSSLYFFKRFFVCFSGSGRCLHVQNIHKRFGFCRGMFDGGWIDVVLYM